MGFLLFLLVNATLFIRPGEIVPELTGLPIYNYMILTNLLVASPAIVNYFDRGSLRQKPATVCVLGVIAGIFISHITKFDLWNARMGAFDFAKVVAYYLLLVVTVNTPRRFVTFLVYIALLILVINGIAVLHYHGVIEVQSIKVLMQNEVDLESGEQYVIPRMQATGIFGDPNDLSMIIVAGIVICVAVFLNPSLGFVRFLFAAPIGFFVYALLLTQSRGGLLALLAACGGLFYARFGAFKAGILLALTAPAIFALASVRQGDIGGAVTGGTGAHRAELWSEGLQRIKAAPLFGIGYGKYGEEMGQVAHNSFVEALAELGLIGGVWFLGLFGCLGLSLYQMREHRAEISDQRLRHLFPYIVALLAAYSVSMMSLSRNYALPTYLIAGLAAVYVSQSRPLTSLPPQYLSNKLIVQIFAGSIGFLGFIYLYINLLIRMG